MLLLAVVVTILSKELDHGQRACMYVCMYVLAHIYIYIYIYICVCVCVD
jgi:hypothetical protein